MASTSSTSTSSQLAASSSSATDKTVSSGKPEQDIYQFKVTLLGVKPPIWRRIQVTDDLTFSAFHEVINSIMGWKNYHLYQFIYKNIIIQERVEEDPGFYGSRKSFSIDLFTVSRNMELDSNETAIKSFYKDQGIKTLTYVYDFGDNWRHKVTLEKIMPYVEGKSYPICLTGRRACPPEDCGGIYGYESLLRKLNDPTHEEHEDLKSWMADNGLANFDPNKFP